MTITATFEGGTVQGSTSCNSFSASYTVSGKAMTFAKLTVTEKACKEPGHQEEEARFLKLIGNL